MKMGNDSYMGMVKGGSQKIMKNHGNTSSIDTTSPQKSDMGRINETKMNSKGYSKKAFGYKY